MSARLPSGIAGVEADPVRPRRRLISGFAVVAFLIWFLVLRHNDPMVARDLVACPVWSTTGLYCTGCGSTRATHELFNLRWSSALQNNVLMVLVGIPVLLGLLIRELVMLFKGRSVVWRLPAWSWTLVIVAFLLFTILRNMPSPVFDVLRPRERMSFLEHDVHGPPVPPVTVHADRLVFRAELHPDHRRGSPAR